ncbi:MAG: hypothetical protein ACREBT_06390 [Thermoplasmata archaeon]
MGRSARIALTLFASALLTVSIVLLPAASAAATPPTLPVGLDSRFVGNLSAPGLVAGTTGVLGLILSDPLSVPIHTIELRLTVYAFNGFPGNATSESGLADPPILTSPGSSGASVYYNISLLPSGDQVSESPGVTSSSSTPIGAYAIRVALTFAVPNGTAYLLESRGWFTSAQWSSATAGPNGTTVVTNRSLALLGVSGLLPETSVQVTSSALSYALYIVLGAALVLAGAAGYVYYRRVERSRSGTR